ncbi:endonuclease/exonuclease/phosphatase family protein [bacterium]|nr:endonuclease/exonuclease/phosphatase family protein [bacterium]
MLRIALLAALGGLLALERGCRVSGEQETEGVHAIGSASPSALAREPGAVTLVTYNVHSLVGTDGRYDPGRIAAVLRETGADIVCLQELGDFRGRVPGDAPEQLARELSMPMLFGTTIERDGRRYGNAILTRFPIVGRRKYDLSAGPLEPRKALRADLELAEGVRLGLVCVHLGLVPVERGAQVAALGDTVLPELDGPVVLCGDFNHWYFARDGAIARRELFDVARKLDREESTFPAGRAFFRLDRAYANRLVCPLEIRVHRSALSAQASDHLPVVFRFEVVRN